MSALKTIVYDEADELYIQDGNLPSFEALFKVLNDIKVAPQHLMFSATFNDDVISRLKSYVGKFELFPLKKEALKLKGVKNFKILLS